MAKKTAEPKDVLASILQKAAEIYSIDKDKAEQNGVEVKVLQVGTFNIRRAHHRSNPKWAEAMQKVWALPDGEAQSAAHREVFVDHLLVSYKTPEGENVPMTEETRESWKKTFNALPDLFDIINQEASRIENFRVVKQKADEKNLLTS